MGGERLLSILQCNEYDDGSSKHISKFNKSNENDLTISGVSDTISNSIERLLEGEFDLVSCSGIAWNKYSDVRDQIVVAAVLPRRDASWVIVSEDNLNYLVKDSKIVCNSELISRQLKRVRPDLVISTYSEWRKEFQSECDDSDLLLELENSRRDGSIQGYAISRADWESSNIKARRHTLGMHKSEKGDSAFTPPPLHGFTLLISRIGFPMKYLQEINDVTSNNVFELESMLEMQMNPEIKNIVGIHVSQRKIGSLLKQAKNEGDLILKNSALSPEGDIESVQTRFNIQIELPDLEGKFTLALERIAALESSNYLTNIIMKDWNELYRVAVENIRKF